MRTIVTQITPCIYQQIDFGITDNKGRSLGLQVSICTVDVKEAPADHKYGAYVGYNKLGQLFCVNMMVTKNGNTFGASQYSTHYDTIGEVQDAIDKRKKSCIARYTKQFAKA
jgi:hypothetical protein